ncbi:unnamed protein product [Paramecium octaurelia]|uniref:Transmembrane protein n=1 Tax=Paramecium octaurelia TaxID=43137 RepID=A0A8S1WDQ6_PAROT|nr:unnamed protein product [Paramecium octaurelia]
MIYLTTQYILQTLYINKKYQQLQIQYLLSLSRNLQSENVLLNPNLNFRVQNGQMILQLSRKVKSKQKNFIGTYYLLKSSGKLVNIFSDPRCFSLSRLFQMWSIQRNQKCNDYLKSIHIVALHIVLCFIVISFSSMGTCYYIFYVLKFKQQEIFNKLYNCTLTSTLTEFFCAFNGYLILQYPTLYQRERIKLVYFFEKLNLSHDLLYYEANLFIINLNTDMKIEDQFKVLFINQACKKEFVTIENILKNQKTTYYTLVIRKQIKIKNCFKIIQKHPQVNKLIQLKSTIYQIKSFKSQQNEIQKRFPQRSLSANYNSQINIKIMIQPQLSMIKNPICVVQSLIIRQLIQLSDMGLIHIFQRIIQSCRKYLEICQTNVQFYKQSLVIYLSLNLHN